MKKAIIAKIHEKGQYNDYTTMYFSDMDWLRTYMKSFRGILWVSEAYNGQIKDSINVIGE